jgi:hypothetical protein
MNEAGLSVIRISGLLAGSFFIITAFFRLRTHRSSRMFDYLLGFSGIVLVIISLQPSLINFVSDLARLTDIKGGRIITLLMIATIVLWYLVVRLGSTNSRLKGQVESIVHHLAISGGMSGPALDRGGPSGVALLIPAYNEEENLRELLPEIPSSTDGHDIHTVVIDDGSSDGTSEIAGHADVKVLRNIVNMGGGSAIRTGLAYAIDSRPLAVVTMDGDGQHAPEDIHSLAKPVIRGEADIVIGSRLLGESEHASVSRRIGITVFNALIRMLTGLKITDCSSGFRAIRTESLNSLKLREHQFHTAELLILAAKHGLRVTERPVTISRRRHGKSKKGSDLTYALSFLKTIITAWLR